MIDNNYKTREFQINSRAKVKIKPIAEFTFVSAYNIKLYYKIKNKITNKLFWYEVNSIRIPSNKLDKITDISNILSSLFDRKTEEEKKYKREVNRIKFLIRNTYMKL